MFVPAQLNQTWLLITSFLIFLNVFFTVPRAYENSGDKRDQHLHYRLSWQSLVGNKILIIITPVLGLLFCLHPSFPIYHCLKSLHRVVWCEIHSELSKVRYQ